MLRTIRLTTAIVCFTLITLLFLDFTGTLHTWFGWLAKIQFLPALLALNIDSRENGAGHGRKCAVLCLFFRWSAVLSFRHQCCPKVDGATEAFRGEEPHFCRSNIIAAARAPVFSVSNRKRSRRAAFRRAILVWTPTISNRPP